MEQVEVRIYKESPFASTAVQEMLTAVYENKDTVPVTLTIGTASHTVPMEVKWIRNVGGWQKGIQFISAQDRKAEAKSYLEELYGPHWKERAKEVFAVTPNE